MTSIRSLRFAPLSPHVLLAGFVLIMGLSAAYDTLGAAPVVLPADAYEATEDEKRFLRAYTKIGKLMAERKWKDAHKRILTLLEEHEGRDYVRFRRTEIAEDLTRCDLRLAVPLPDPKKLLSGDLKSYQARTGKIKLIYTPDQLADFEEGGVDVLLHPAPFVGPFNVEITGDEYTVQSLGVSRFLTLTLFACLEEDRFYRICPGHHQKSEMFETWTNASIEKVAGDTATSLASKKSVIEREQKYRIKLAVSTSQITLSYKGRTVVKAKKAKDRWGRLGIAHMPAFTRITIDGKVDPTWMQGLFDKNVHDAEQEFLKSYDVNAHLPAWLLDGRKEKPDTGLDIEHMPWPITSEQERYFDAAAKLIENESAGELLDYLLELPNDALPADMQRFLLVAAYSMNGGLHEALDLCEQVCDRNPDFLSAGFVRAALLRQVGSLEQAAEKFESLLEKAPKNVDIYVGLCRTSLLRGDRDRAREVVLLARRAELRHPKLDEVDSILVKADRGPNWLRAHQVDSEHYLVASDVNSKVCAEIARVLEELHELVSADLGKLATEWTGGGKCKVFIFSSEARYDAYAEHLFTTEPHNTVGLYSKLVKQLLVLNDPRNKGDAANIARHEGFHQYLDGLGANAPTWFEEGLAEYYSYLVKNRFGRTLSVGAVFESYVRLLQQNAERLIPLDEFVRIQGNIFYKDLEILYPQAWALVYFLRNGDGALRTIYDKLLEGSLSGIGPKRCVDAAFEGVDLDELQGKFVEFLEGM